GRWGGLWGGRVAGGRGGGGGGGGAGGRRGRGGRHAALRHIARPRRRQPRAAAHRGGRAVPSHSHGSGDRPMMLRDLARVATIFAVACGGDRTRSPTCGMALLISPSLIQEQLR